MRETAVRRDGRNAAPLADRTCGDLETFGNAGLQPALRSDACHGVHDQTYSRI